MAETMFNIFGDNLAKPVHRQLLREITNENAVVGKSGLSSALTPAKKNINSLTPRHTDSKKKTFLQNKSTPIQLSGVEGKRSVLQMFTQQNSLRVYNDNPVPAKPEISAEDMIRIEYTHKNIIEDDDLMGEESGEWEEVVEAMVLGLPTSRTPPPRFHTNEDAFLMVQPLKHFSLDDVLTEDDYCGNITEPNLDDTDILI